MIFDSNLTKVTLPLHNFALVVKYFFRWDNCIEKKLSPVGSQGVLSERNVGYISCKQAFCSKLWNIYRNSPAKLFLFSIFFRTFFTHIELQICIKANFELGSWIAAGCGGAFSNEKKSILKMQKLGRGGQRTVEICSN